MKNPITKKIKILNNCKFFSFIASRQRPANQPPIRQIYKTGTQNPTTTSQIRKL
jgi:hypothetical protein